MFWFFFVDRWRRASYKWRFVGKGGINVYFSVADTG
jgi:hypothetical protein